MRLAFYAPMKPPGHPSPSGDRQMARLLWAALTRAGHEMELASTFRSWDGRGDPVRQRRIAELGRRIAARIVRRYRERPVADRPQLWFTYHLYHKAPDWLGPVVTRVLGIPYVVAEASFAPKRTDGRWALGHDAAARAIAAADLIVVVNGTDQECLLPLVREPGRLQRLAPFIDARSFFRAGADRAGQRWTIAQKLDLDLRAPVLATVAMMRGGDKLRSYRVLGGALARIMDRPWTLLVAGDGPARDEARAALSPLGERVRWLGLVGQDELPAVCAAAEIYVWPAVNEAYGLAFLEAQAAGAPVVAGRYGGVAEVVRDRDTGLLAAVGDAAAFAAGVACLLDDAALRTAMSRRAVEHVRRRHDLPAASSRLDRLVRTCMSKFIPGPMLHSVPGEVPR